MGHERKKAKNKTSIIISLVVHAVVVVGLFYWAAKTGIIPEEVSRVFNIAQAKKIPPKKEKPPEPPKATKADLKNQNRLPASTPVPSAGPSARAADPNAMPSRGDNPFDGAAVRDPNAAPAAVIQGQGTMGTGPATTTAMRVAPTRASSGPPSMFSKEALRPSTVASILAERRSAVAAQDAISSEQINRSGAGDAAAVVSKVAGASIVDGKFVVVRGLSDRYNVTTLNGADIPTADPYRKAAQLDLIPSSMVDRIVINKTFTPDQPGGFAGGAVNIVTKSFPPQPFATVSVGMEYNLQSSLRNDFSTYKGGAFDWAAVDDGTRSLPAAIASLPGGVIPSLPARNQESRAMELSSLGKSFKTTQFAAVRGESPLNHSFSTSIGDSALLLGRPFGAFGSLSYQRTFTQIDDGVNDRYDISLNRVKSLADTRGVMEANWGAAANLAWQPLPDHELSFTFVKNQSAEDNARRRIGTVRDEESTLDLNTLSWTERSLQSFQLKGQHKFPDLRDARLDWLAALSGTSQEEPDQRFFNYFRNGSEFQLNNNAADQPIFPTRFFRRLEEENLNWKLDATVPFDWWSGLTGELKAGANFSNSERTYRQTAVEYLSLMPAGSPSYPGFSDPTDPNTFLTPDLLDYFTRVISFRGNRFTNYYFPRYISTPLGGNQGYEGTQDIGAYYGMATVPLTELTRITGGARVESTLITTRADGFQGSTSSRLSQTDVLPAVNAVIGLSTNVSIRLSAAETLTRPTFREIAGVRAYDLPTDTLLEGNPNLSASSVKNLDARLEWFPRAGEIFAVSVFYKDIANPIEKEAINQEANILTYRNRSQAKLYGLEFEARKRLDFLSPELSCFTAGMNFSLIQSEVPLTPEERFNKGRFATPNRPLYDQSPYILNADLTYEQPYWGTAVTLNLSLAGERIFFVNPASADVYEHPPMTLDLVISQRIGRNLRIRLTARNLLDSPTEVTVGKQPGVNRYTYFHRGTAFGLNLIYDF